MFEFSKKLLCLILTISNLQVVQGKGITADEYEGSPLQDTRDLAYYNITESSEIVYERIILPNFQKFARYFEKVTAIREYLKYRFGDIYKFKNIHNYYSAAHKYNSSANSNNNHIVGSVQSYSTEIITIISLQMCTLLQYASNLLYALIISFNHV